MYLKKYYICGHNVYTGCFMMLVSAFGLIFLTTVLWKIVWAPFSLFETKIYLVYRNVIQIFRQTLHKTKQVNSDVISRC